MSRVQFHKIWVQQCRATRGIKRRFGVKSALDYLIGEKLMSFADAAEQHPEFATELPRFQATVWNVFNPYCNESRSFPPKFSNYFPASFSDSFSA